MLMALSTVITSCEDILGEWDRPTPANVTPTDTSKPEQEPEQEPEATLTMLQTPLTFEAATAGANVTFTVKIATGVEYSTDGKNWSAYTSGTAITLANAGDKVMFRGTNATYADSDINKSSSITCDADCYIYGNIMSLIKKENFESETTLTGDRTFQNMFKDNIHIKNHTDATKYLVLPATKMTLWCYSSMFNGCTGLTKTPVINVDCDGKNGCMKHMFNNCDNLTTIAEGSRISGDMGANCCENMFSGCDKLASVPSDLLPSTSLANYCYQGMFQGCKELTNTPKLPAPTANLSTKCYYKMFEQCSKLNEAWVKADYTTSENKCTDMFRNSGVNASTSKFYTDGTWAAWKTAFSGINAWTKYPYTPGLLEGKFSINAGGDKVQFSQGNLRYTSGSWSFFDHQYDSYTAYDADSWDKFGWSTSANNYGMTTSTDDATYSGDFKDWGETMGPGWRTLNKDEWNYLFNTRTSGSTVNEVSDARYTHATINTDGTSVKGIILFPNGVTIAPGEANYWGNINADAYVDTHSTPTILYDSKCTTAQWTALAAKGCVFLPFTGFRSGTSINEISERGYYWSSSPYSDTESYYVGFSPTTLWATNEHSLRSYGYSVRLVCDVN